MSGSRIPPRAASWFLRHLGCSLNNDAMLGDIQEQFARGKSRLWFWQEVISAVFTGAYASIISRGSPTMKRTIVWTTALVCVFSLGYLTARSPFLVNEEMPSADLIAEMKEQRQRADAHRRESRRDQREASALFLKMAVRAAELDYNKSGTAVSKAKLGELKQRLQEVQRLKQDESKWVDRWVER